MQINGQLTRQRALLGAGLLIATLVIGGKLLLGTGASPRPLRVAEPPAAPPAVATTARPAPDGASAPAGAPLDAPAVTTPAGIVVHVVGAVRRPGLYRLREGSRAADAVARAGGATAQANLEAIDLAAPIADGQQVAVPRRDDAGASPAPSPSPSGAGPAARMGPVHLNTATVEQLDALPGIGPATAQKIVDYRQQHGFFRSVDELDAIPGIGVARIEQLRKLVAP